MSHIIFSITIVARDVKHALALEAELIKAGKGAEIAVDSSRVANSPKMASGAKGPHELAYLKANPDKSQFRLSQGMVNLVATIKAKNKESMPADKDSIIGAFVAYVASGAIQKTAGGYVLGGSNYSPSVSGADSDDETNLGEGIDPDEVV